MPTQQITKLEALTEQLNDIVVLMQQVMDFRQQKADDRYDELKNLIATLQQQADNGIEANTQINQALGNIHVKLHILSNHIMSLGNSVEELAEYMSMIEATQVQIKEKLHLTDD